MLHIDLIVLISKHIQCLARSYIKEDEELEFLCDTF